MKYAIKVLLSKEENDWIYVTEDTGRCDWNIVPKLFDDFETANYFADTWRIKGKENFVKVVKYDEN